MVSGIGCNVWVWCLLSIEDAEGNGERQRTWTSHQAAAAHQMSAHPLDHADHRKAAFLSTAKSSFLGLVKLFHGPCCAESHISWAFIIIGELCLWGACSLDTGPSTAGDALTLKQGVGGDSHSFRRRCMSQEE